MLMKGLLRGQLDELNYQPLPWLKNGGAQRAAGTISRFAAIEKFLKGEGTVPRVALDIGSHVGFFSLSLAKKGWLVYAVESNKERLYLSYILSHRIKANIVPLRLLINTDNVEYLPEADVTLCMSVWHHWVRRYGLEEATFILKAILRKTRRFLFFDAGEGEMSDTYKLPYGSEKASEFLSRYLNEFPNLEAVLNLGEHQAFSPPNEKGVRTQALRTLFCLKKGST